VRVLIKTGMAVALGQVILAGLDKIAARFEPLDEVLPEPFVDKVLEPIRLHGAVVWSVLEGSGWPAMLTWEASAWFPALAVVWLAWRSLGLLASAQSTRPTPLDRVFDSPGSARRFLGFWTALSALFLAALPGLALAGLIALHHVLAIFVP
jgi:hypothetical protein